MKKENDIKEPDALETKGASALGAVPCSEPRAGETWKFEMTSSATGRAVWWTRKIKSVYGAEGERWCDWAEKRSHLRDCTTVEVVAAGRLISQNAETTQSANGDKL